MNYQRINATTKIAIGEPEPLPDIFAGLDDNSLADLASIDPTPEGYEGQGFVPVVDPEPPAPAAFYLSKTLFEDRMTDAQFVAFDAVRLNVEARPIDWATNPAWDAQRAFVRPMLRYASADSVNLKDVGLYATFEGFAQLHPEVFGSDPQAEIGRLLKPELLPGEKLASA